jgi:hypothetical protein
MQAVPLLVSKKYVHLYVKFRPFASKCSEINTNILRKKMNWVVGEIVS